MCKHRGQTFNINFVRRPVALHYRTGGTPSVQYTYGDGAVGGVAKYVRLEQVTYPDGIREIHYN